MITGETKELVFVIALWVGEWEGREETSGPWNPPFFVVAFEQRCNQSEIAMAPCLCFHVALNCFLK